MIHFRKFFNHWKQRVQSKRAFFRCAWKLFFSHENGDAHLKYYFTYFEAKIFSSRQRKKSVWRPFESQLTEKSWNSHNHLQLQRQHIKVTIISVCFHSWWNMKLTIICRNLQDDCESSNSIWNVSDECSYKLIFVVEEMLLWRNVISYFH